MRRKLTLLLIFLPALLMGQAKIHLEFESGGPRIGWVSNQPSAPPDSAAKWDAKSYDLDLGTSNSSSTIFVLDTASGNLAERKIGDGKAWLVKDADFKSIAEVKVRVEHEGKPVQEADVVAGDGSHSQNLLIDSTSAGTAEMFDVKPGNISVDVNYHSGSGTKIQKQSFPLELKRDSAVPLLVVSITSEVATVPAGPTSGGGSTPSSPGGPGTTASGAHSSETPQQRTVGNIAVYLFGVLLAVAIIYGGYLWLQKNHGTAQNALQKVGLSLQDPNPFDPTTATPINDVRLPAAPTPQPQILLGDAAPTPLAGIPQPMSNGSPYAVVHSPHLLRDNGETLELPEGSSTLGRDGGIQLSFPAENSLSRRHAEIVRNGSQVVVRDLGSTNGTFVNGSKVNGDTPLRAGDTVQFGMIRFRYEG